MRTAVTSLVVVALSALLAAPTAKADHHEPNAWWKYLIGTWSVEDNDGQKSENTYKMAPAGKALIAERRDEDGTSTFIVVGHQGENEVSTGYSSDGASWQITGKLPMGDRREGVMLGRNNEGIDWNGKIVSEKISNDQWKWEISGKRSNGEAINVSATLTRKK